MPGFSGVRVEDFEPALEQAMQDLDPVETQEWLDALETVLEQEGPERAHYLLEKLVEKARRSGAHSAAHRRNRRHSTKLRQTAF